MPPPTTWLRRVPDAVRQLEAYPHERIARGELQTLLGVSERRARQLMRAWGATRRGGRGDLWVEKESLVRRLKALHRGRAYRAEATRVAQLQAVLQEAVIRRAAVVTVPRAAITARLAGLPDGVTVTRGDIRITFATSEEAGARVVALLQALTADWRQFQAFVDVSVPAAVRPRGGGGGS